MFRVATCLRGTAMLVLSLASSFAPAAEPTVSRRWALLIGVNDYVSLRPLQSPVRDMQAFRDQLVACGFPDDQV